MTRKRRQRHTVSVCLACALIQGACGLLYWALTSKRLASRVPDTERESAFDRVGIPPVRPAAVRAPPRTIYPYSVIRGGAYSVAELDVALRTDPVVAAHYADFDRTQMRIRQAPANAAVYVSYRKGDHVYWTSRKVHLTPDEPLLSDGVYLARARCGNRVSLTRQEPSQSREPSEIELDLPELSPTADVPLDVNYQFRLAYEILPQMVGNSPSYSVGLLTGSSASSGRMLFPIFLGSPPPGFELPLTIPGVFPTFAVLPAPTVGPWIVLPPPVPPSGYEVSMPTGIGPWGTGPTLSSVTVPPFLGNSSFPGAPAFPVPLPLPGVGVSRTPRIPVVELSATASGPALPPTFSDGRPPEIRFPPTGPLPSDAEIPEPATAALLLCGAAVLVTCRLCRRRPRLHHATNRSLAACNKGRGNS